FPSTWVTDYSEHIGNTFEHTRNTDHRPNDLPRSAGGNLHFREEIERNLDVQLQHDSHRLFGFVGEVPHSAEEQIGRGEPAGVVRFVPHEEQDAPVRARAGAIPSTSL